jgi:hypothetical protein
MAEEVRAQLRSLFSPDADPLDQFAPEGPFGILVMAMIGPADARGQESFDFMLCIPDWFASSMGDIADGRHHVFVKEFDYSRLKGFVENYCARCHGTSWREVGEKLGRLGKWEFEDYREYKVPPPLW